MYDQLAVTHCLCCGMSVETDGHSYVCPDHGRMAVTATDMNFD